MSDTTINIDLTKQDREILAEIAIFYGLPNRVSFPFRRCLRLFKLLLDHNKKGSEIVIRSTDGKEMLLPLSLL